MKTNRRSEEEWKEIIQAGKRRKGSIQEWCETNAINPTTYKYWVNRLNKKERTTSIVAPAFVELSLPDQTSTQEKLKSKSKEILIRYRDFELLIPKDTDQELLAQVLSALQESC